MTAAVITCGPRKLTQFSVLNALANYADDFGFACPSLQTIATDARCDLRTAMRQVAELEAEGWLYCARKVLNGKSNVYILNLPKLGVSVSPTGKRSPLFTRLMRMSGDRLTPVFRERGEGLEDLQNHVENPVEPFFSPEKSGDTTQFSGDNPQPTQVTEPESQVTKQGGSGDIACHPNRYNRYEQNHQGTVSEEEIPPTPQGAAEDGREGEQAEGEQAEELPEPPAARLDPLTDDPADGPKFTAFKQALKLDLASMPNHPNFTQLKRGERDYDACFREWWLVHIRRHSNAWVFETEAACPYWTRAGTEKYQKRLESTIREYFPVSKHAEIRFAVRRAGGRPEEMPSAQAKAIRDP